MRAEQTAAAVVMALAWLLLLTFLAIAVVDAVLAALRVPPVGVRMHRWSRHHPSFTAAMILILGALIGHFFTRDLGLGW
jgi:hypothetical protein